MSWFKKADDVSHQNHRCNRRCNSLQVSAPRTVAVGRWEKSTNKGGVCQRTKPQRLTFFIEEDRDTITVCNSSLPGAPQQQEILVCIVRKTYEKYPFSTFQSLHIRIRKRPSAHISLFDSEVKISTAVAENFRKLSWNFLGTVKKW